MAKIITEKYDSKDLFEKLYHDYDRATYKSLSKLLSYVTPGKYRFLTSDRTPLFGIRYITYNSGKQIILPLVEGTLFQKNQKGYNYLSFVIDNNVHSKLMIIPIQYIVQMQANATYIITIDDKGDVTHIRNEVEEDYDEEKEEYTF